MEGILTPHKVNTWTVFKSDCFFSFVCGQVKICHAQTMRLLETPALNEDTIEMTSPMEKPSSNISKVRMALPIGRCDSTIQVGLWEGRPPFLVPQHPCSVGKLLQEEFAGGRMGHIRFHPLCSFGWNNYGFLLDQTLRVRWVGQDFSIGWWLVGTEQVYFCHNPDTSYGQVLGSILLRRICIL